MDEPTTIRDSLEAAIEQTEAAPAPAPVEAPAPIEAESPAIEASVETGAASQDLNALAEKGTPPRDEQGKFTKQESTPEITPGPKSGPKIDRAPASWRPELREHWSSVPDPVKEIIAKREYEIDKTLKETIDARQYAEAVNKAFQPYEAYIRAENANPLQVIDNLMGTAVRLRTATGPELANLMAGMVQQYGTGRFGPQFIEMLDGALSGNAPAGNPAQAQIQQAIQQQLAPVQNFMQQFQQMQEVQKAKLAQQAAGEVEQFLTRAEFGQDVRSEMADIMELAEKRGQTLSLQDAYRQACMLNEGVRNTLQQRAKAKQAQSQTAVAQKARAAAVSVPSAGPKMGNVRPPQDDIRTAIEAAIAMNSR